MATPLSTLETIARRHLVETTARFWSSAELIDLASAGVRDLWRDIVDLKAEHFCTIDTINVSIAANGTTLSGVPQDVHKVYLIEPRNTTTSGSNTGLIFKPKDYNHPDFQSARALSAVDPTNACIYYAIIKQGAPVNAPTIVIAPSMTSLVNLAFTYVPTLGTLSANADNPIPGEADNAVVAWMVAFARAKEREDRSPDPEWLAIYATEKQHLLQSLGLRQLQEPMFVDAVYEQYW